MLYNTHYTEGKKVFLINLNQKLQAFYSFRMILIKIKNIRQSLLLIQGSELKNNVLLYMLGI